MDIAYHNHDMKCNKGVIEPAEPTFIHIGIRPVYQNLHNYVTYSKV